MEQGTPDTAGSQWHPAVAAFAADTGLAPQAVAIVLGPTLALTPQARNARYLPTDPIVGRAVRWAALHAVPAAAISARLELDPALVTGYLNGGDNRAPSRKAIEAVRLAKAGRSGTEILRQLGIESKGWLYRTLHNAGVDPSPFGDRAATNADQRAQAVKLYRKGYRYVDIVQATGLTLQNVKNVLRAAHKRGDLPEYGTRAGR